MLKKGLCLLLTLLLICPCALGEVTIDGDNEDEESIFPSEVIEEEEVINFEPIPWTEKKSPNIPDPSCYLPNNGGYVDDSLAISIETFRMHDTTVMKIHVQLTDVSQFRTGMADIREPWSQTAKVSTLAKRFRAVLAINGDYFGYHSEGIVWRNGKQLRLRPNKKRDTLIVDTNGDFHILKPSTREAWDNFPLEVLHAFCFGPALVIDGEVCQDVSETNMNLGPNKTTQRIAIGQLGRLEYLIVATEGPENEGSVGFTMQQMADLMGELGCITAYNLDGGSSSSVVLNNEKINALSTGKVRLVSDCIWFATLVDSSGKK